ncbi:hypothetical protein ADL26_17645 [Thermoactinomyces vulgaris]|jgi:hypothetical protein|nr:hypothetical protein ADL26_17645 [Thermoactinomyces vulgaris]
MSGSQIILVFDIMNMLEMTEVHIRVLVVAIVVLKLNSASTNVSSAIVLVVAIVVLKLPLAVRGLHLNKVLVVTIGIKTRDPAMSDF